MKSIPPRRCRTETGSDKLSLSSWKRRLCDNDKRPEQPKQPSHRGGQNMLAKTRKTEATTQLWSWGGSEQDETKIRGVFLSHKETMMMFEFEWNLGQSKE